MTAQEFHAALEFLAERASSAAARAEAAARGTSQWSCEDRAAWRAESEAAWVATAARENAARAGADVLRAREDARERERETWI